MGRILSQNRRRITSKRIKFLLHEIIPIFFTIFLVLILEWVLIPLIVNQSTGMFGFIFHYIRAIVIFLVIILVLFISNKYQTKNTKQSEEHIAGHIGFLKLYNVNRKNYKYQLLYSILLFFLLLVPLGFLMFITEPNAVPYRAFSQLINNENSYLLVDNFALFLLYSVIIQFSISFSEETIFRGLITKRGSEYFNKLSAVMISTFCFTFIDFFLNPFSFLISFHSGIVWFCRSFIIGLVFSLTITRRKWLIPLIISRTLDSVISNVIIWDFLGGGNSIQLLFFIYIPLLLISIILLILQRSRVKESLQIGIKMIKSYFSNDIKLEKSKGDKIFRILFDIIFAFILFLFGILISV